ncbi:MAG TPA: ATP-binding protein, partial [Saprospiraceae bacterium]|nr:ATP-binding protein [Saprospiraceae bacterium]
KDVKRNFSNNSTVLVYNIDSYIGCPLFSVDAKPIGIIAVMQQKEIKDISYTKSLLKIAAKRTELELEKINYQKMLETKNIELERQNTELASFNYIASHDLQEPLRKIITFSNRLFQKYNESLPEGSREYLERIISSAKRMSTLIEDLLNFSWISNTTEAFVVTDLNEIVKQVLVDLEEFNFQRDANIQVGHLPELKANPLQMTQLFLNLIGNALKFSREGIKPEISISAKDLKVDELKEYENLHHNLTYVKISVKDNGIGFEQKYADKIFTLFQRLHGKNEYHGTGIGLALTKKIVENHNGHISAQSEINKGAIFIVILPKTT